MKVEQNGKTLWHIQNKNICSDGTPYDMFLWSENEPTLEEIVKAFKEDYADCEDWQVEEWETSSEIYAVYAEEV